MDTMASQIISLTIVYLTVYSSADQRKLRVTGLCGGISSVNSPHKGSVTLKMFPFDDVIMDSTEKKLHRRYMIKLRMGINQISMEMFNVRWDIHETTFHAK